MKLFSRYVFLLLVVFFVPLLAGKDAQRIFGHQLNSVETKAADCKQADNTGKIFFSESEDLPENNFEEHDICLKSFLPSKQHQTQEFSANSVSASHFPDNTSQGKLFLLFHALKLDC